jgi:CheY-like chemotaxis protein
MSLPLFSYPATVVCVDDDPLFIASVTQLLKNSHTTTFNSPEQSIKFFQQYKPLLQKINFMRGYTEVEGYDMLNHMPVDFNVSALKELYTNSERSGEVTVLVTDYNMPSMNGIDLCRALRALPMKKILLTGAADYQQAVTAFNEGLIDCFIQKDSQTLAQDILFHLKRLSHQYFVDRSRQLLNHLETDYPLPLSDPIFISFFEEWCKKNEIQEYYLIDKHGNFLLIDKEGKKSYFIIHTERTLGVFIEFHQDDKESAPFIRAVESGEKIPFFGEGVESWELQPDQWAACFYSSQLLVGQQKYYWAIAN